MSLPTKPLKVILYAAFVGLLLASYVTPLQQIFESRGRISALQSDLEGLKKNNAAKTRLTEDLQTPEGIELAARERYGMVKPGEKAYVLPEEGK